MEELSAAIEKAEKIVVYAEGEARAYLAQDAAFAALMRAWEETVSAAVRMPAFGVSIDALTRKGRESGLVDGVLLRGRASLRRHAVRVAAA